MIVWAVCTSTSTELRSPFTGSVGCGSSAPVKIDGLLPSEKFEVSEDQISSVGKISEGE